MPTPFGGVYGLPEVEMPFEIRSVMEQKKVALYDTVAVCAKTACRITGLVCIPALL